ncbi:MAG TPA: hypothetical protein VI976_01935 [Candidatus Omnitrophota bacterium]|nr:hypothetical protein [Candidatus Omnitrophota bacterium]
MAFKEKILKPIDIGEKIQFVILQKFSGEKRVYLGAQLYEMSKHLIRDGIRDSHPGLNDDEINRRTREIISPWIKKRH